jgi:hypothetical protein
LATAIAAWPAKLDVGGKYLALIAANLRAPVLPDGADRESTNAAKRVGRKV